MTATVARRAPNGRYAKQPANPTHCGTCGNWLAEGLLGNLRCLRPRCEKYRVVVGTVPGIDVGTLADALGVEE